MEASEGLEVIQLKRILGQYLYSITTSKVSHLAGYDLST